MPEARKTQGPPAKLTRPTGWGGGSARGSGEAQAEEITYTHRGTQGHTQTSKDELSNTRIGTYSSQKPGSPLSPQPPAKHAFQRLGTEEPGPIHHPAWNDPLILRFGDVAFGLHPGISET